MSEIHSNPSAVSGKPAKPSKPYETYPLYAHAAGYWAKKIRGKVHYFGPWSDPDGALDKYMSERDALHAGRKPRADPDALTVKEAANEFLNAKQERLDSGELSPRTFADYRRVAELVVAQFGKQRLVIDLDPSDFASLRNKAAKKWGPHRLSATIQYARSIFKHAFDAGLIDRPVRFGPNFKRPNKKTMRLHRAEKGPKLFTPPQVRALVRKAGQPLRAMILLGCNCGFGNSDCATLPLTALDLAAGWVDFARPKTGIGRRCPLWPETVDALREALARRKQPRKAEHADLVFITLRGDSWGKDTTDNPISKEVAKLLKKLKLHRGKGLGFYTLRHVFRTVADESKDQPAVDFIMGHESPHMSSVYRETISNERLKAVSDYVRAWLFAPPKVAEATTAVAKESLRCEE